MPEVEDYQPDLTDGSPNTIGLVAALLAAIGALNVGLGELFDMHLLTGVLSLTGDPLMYAHVAIGAGGLLMLIDLADHWGVL